MLMWFLLFFSTVTSAAPIPSYGGLIHWPISEEFPRISYYIDSTNSGFINTTNEAFVDWEQVPSAYIIPVWRGVSEGSSIVIKVLPKLDNANAAGQAVYEFDENGYFKHCEVQLPESEATKPYDTIKPILVHEIGHCLGLQHSVVPGAVMSYRGTGKVPTADDRYALTLLYPTGIDERLPRGCAGFLAADNHGNDPRNSNGRPGSPGHGLGILLSSAFLLALVWVGTRRWT